jgi:hypothetical protein
MQHNADIGLFTEPSMITIPGMDALETVRKWLLLQTGLYKRIRWSFKMPSRGDFKELPVLVAEKGAAKSNLSRRPFQNAHFDFAPRQGLIL